MTDSSNRIVLYRATRDGFTAKELKNEKCDGIENTVTIIKTDSILYMYLVVMLLRDGTPNVKINKNTRVHSSSVLKEMKKLQ
jgi:hypothetical protein